MENRMCFDSSSVISSFSLGCTKGMLIAFVGLVVMTMACAQSRPFPSVSDEGVTVLPTLNTGEVMEITSTSTPTYEPTFVPQPPLLGVAVEKYDSESGFEVALEHGAFWLRRWTPISWRDVEPVEGEFRWDRLTGLESELLRAHAAGVEPILWVHFVPEWAQAVVPYTCGPIREDKFEAFARFMEQLVSRYGSTSPYGVRYWQIGNELDVAPQEVRSDSLFGCWGDVNDAYYGGGYYAQMLQVVYPAIKAADPEAQVKLVRVTSSAR